MKPVVVRAAQTEIEANAVAAYLKSLGCPAAVKPRTIVAVPGAAEPPGDFAEVLVSAEDADRAKTFLVDYDAFAEVEAGDFLDQPVTPKAQSSEQPGTPVGTLALRGAVLASLAFNAYAAYVLYIEPRLAHSVVATNAEGQKLAVERYRGADFPYERDLFDSHQTLRQRSLDHDANGWFERILRPLLEIRGRSFEESQPHFVDIDADQDGVIESSTLIGEGRARVSWRDADRDGVHDHFQRLDNGFELIDVDGDAFPDRFVCGTPVTGLLMVNLRTCPPSLYQ